MQYFILGLLLLLLAYAAFRAFLNANPKDLAKVLRNIGGIALLLLALFFAVTGRFPLAVPFGILALSLLGRSLAAGFNPFQGSANKSAGQRSRVRTRSIEMELDHDTGEMDGRVIKGRFASRKLSSMTQRELIALRVECQKSDQQAVQLLEAYLDRFFPEWRKDAGQSDSSGRRRKSRSGSDGPMSAEEAYEILGLVPGASKADIRRAHRTLMKKLHPDQGGSTYLAAKINEAKDVLLG
jgi:curved DNA-binding protein CbpA